MLRKVPSTSLHISRHGWLESRFHFSFAEYYEPSNIHFGCLRVLNDDLIAPGSGFDMHSHKGMEIISYVVEGSLEHKDSMGNQSVLSRGDVQYMSAGTGIYHSEYNAGNTTLRILQLWILPDAKNYPPNYGEYRFDWKDRENQFLYMVSGKNGNAPIQINQDANLYSSYLTQPIELKFKTNRKVYLVMIEGAGYINGEFLKDKDAIQCITDSIKIDPEGETHILLIDMSV